MLDSDEIGLIATGVFIFVFLVIFVIIFGCLFHRYFEKKRAKNFQNNLLNFPHEGQAGWPGYGVESRSGRTATASEANSESPHKIGGYRPKILGEDDNQSLSAYTPHTQTPHDSLRSKDKKKKSKGKHHQKKEDIRNSILNGAVTVVHVNDENEMSNGEVVRGHLSHQVINGQYVRTTASPRPRHEVVQGLITVPSSEGQLVVGQSSRNNGSDDFAQAHSSQPNLGGEVVHGHVVVPEIVRGHVIKQNVVLGEDGKLVVASLEEKEVRSEEALQSRYEQWREGIGADQRNNVDTYTSESQRPSHIQGISNAGDITQSHRSYLGNITDDRRQDLGYVINTQERIIDDWPTPGQMLREQVTETSAAQIPQIQIEDDEQMVRDIGDAIGGDFAQRTRDDSFSEFVNDRENYKVVKINRSSHHDLPDWRVSPTPESGATLDLPDDDADEIFEPSAEQRLSAMISNDEDTVDQNFGVVRANVPNTQTSDDVAINEGSSSTRVTLGGAVASIMGSEYANTNDVVITDYVDSEPREAVSQTFSRIEEDADVNTRASATTVRQITQSQPEGSSYNFTSTPRFPPESQGFETTYVNSGRGVAFADEENEHPRQRTYFNDYLDPPSVNTQM